MTGTLIEKNTPLHGIRVKMKILILGASSDIGVELTKIFKNNWKVLAHYNSNFLT